MKQKAYGISLYKKVDGETFILLCKSTKSRHKWGFLKGCSEYGETKEQTAIREFFEESSILIRPNELKKYFEQKNEQKDIGVFLVDYHRIKNLDKFFKEEKLLAKYLSWENSQAEFFNLEKLPKIKRKQLTLVQEVIDHLKNN